MSANLESTSPESLPRPASAGHGSRSHGNPSVIRRNKIVVIVLFSGMLFFAMLNVWLSVRRPSLPDEIDGVVRFDNLASEVVAGPVAYDTRPPAGGQHAELPQLCGLYRVQVADENLVASLATGAIWIAYDPNLPEGDIETLRETAQGELDVVVAPYEGLGAPVVATAWGRQLTLTDPEDERLEMFIVVYRNHERAPLVDETCARGVGLPAP